MTTLSALIHAPAKVGKTTLTTTAPLPILALDAEGGWKYVRQVGYRSGVPLRRIEWDPLAGPPPRHDDTWDFCHVLIRQWATLTQAYQYLAVPTYHDFQSVVIDSITEAQRKLKEKLKPNMEAMRIQDWGDLLVQMDRLIRGYRDLTLLPPPSTLRCILFIAETEMKDGMWRPAMQGQIGRTLPYWVDVCGYLFTTLGADADGNNTVKQKQLLIGEGVSPSIVAGERLQGALPDIIDNPSITQMMQQVFGDVVSPGATIGSDATPEVVSK